MISQSGFDIKVIVNELNELKNSRVEKFYNTSDGELLIRLYSAKFGKVVIRVLRGESIHLTTFVRDSNRIPSHFTMLMRKYMSNSKLLDVNQPFFERVVIFKVKKGDDIFNIVIELFNKGNIVVCDKDMVIINSVVFSKINDRIIKPREIYKLPEPKFKEGFLDKLEFKRLIKTSSMDSIVKCLASEFGMGGKYATEVLVLANIDKSIVPYKLNDDLLEDLFKVFFLMQNSVKHYQNIKPCVVLDKDNVVVNFFPFPFKSFESYRFKFFDSFNQACDFYYSKIQRFEYENRLRVAFNSKLKQLNDRLIKQEEQVKFLRDESKRLSRLGEVIFSNFDLVNNVLSTLLKANKKNLSWDEIRKLISKDKSNNNIYANSIKEVYDNGFVLFDIDDVNFKANINDNASNLAQFFFNKSKKLKSKIDGALNSVNITKDKINELKSKGFKVEEKFVKKVKKNKLWFEKYRWTITRNGLLFVCGKDAVSNEIIVKKVCEDDDLIFHSVAPGSPFGVLKKGINASMEDKIDCANFVASFSKGWRDNVPVSVFAVKKEQVSKTAPSGEYVAHGAFVIKGEKEFFNDIWPKLFIGEDENNKIICSASLETIKLHSSHFVKLLPGNISPGKISNRLITIFGDSVKRVSEEFLQFIPGNSRIVID